MAGLKQIVLVTNIPTPYRIPLFNELDQQLKKAGYSFCVIFGGKGYSRRKWKVDLATCRFSYRFLKSHTFQLGKNEERVAFVYSGLGVLLRELRPDLLIVPGFSMATLKALWLLITRGCRYIIWTGSTGGNRRRMNGWLRIFRQVLAKHAVAAIVYGSKAGAYMKTLGMEVQKVFTAINTVDTSFFEASTRRCRLQSAARDKKYLTYIGALSARKNVMQLLEIVSDLSKSRDDFFFEIIGDGEEMDTLKQFVVAQQLEGVVFFRGYRQKQDIPQFLARSNAFLFQTDYDIWGLVLNEAMAAGVPCLVSCNAGASEDLIREGETGFTVDFSDVATALQRINWVLDNPGPARLLGEKASRFISEHANLSRSARGFVEAIQYTFQHVGS